MTDMYICLCNAVKQSEIEKAIEEGITTLAGLQDKLEVAVNCGACIHDVAGILARKRLFVLNTNEGA